MGNPQEENKHLDLIKVHKRLEKCTVYFVIQDWSSSIFQTTYLRVKETKMDKFDSYGKTPSLFTFNYTIEDFQHQCRFPHTEHFFVQGGFQLNGMEALARFYPRGYSNDDENWLSLYIGLESNVDVEIYTYFEVNIIAMVENSEIIVFSNQYQLLFTPGFMWNAINILPTEVALKRMLLPEGGLKVRILFNTYLCETDRRLSRSMSGMWTRVREMLEQDTGDQDFDVAFLIGTRHFLAHKRILAYSSAFSAILNEWSGVEGLIIELPYVRPDVFEERLIDCYMKSNRFCKECLSVRKSKVEICC